ncbi:MAG: hypothetical protein ACK5KT_09815 [Dysgonomonas sp.]
MMKKITFILFLLFSVSVYSQNTELDKIAQDITEEGKLLYRLELAAWYGMDIFKDNFKENNRIGGYFSYLDSNTPKCLIFSNEQNPRVIGVVSFGDIKLIETATIDFKKRDFKVNEKELYTIRAKALIEIQQDTLFKNYTNTNLNLIPLIYKDARKVYVLTGPKNVGVVLFGNDYLMSFDKQHNLTEKKELHKNLIPIEFDEDKDTSLTIHYHSSASDDFITPTDICTLMLYAKFAGWKKHIVVSQNYASIWDCENETLQIMTKEEFQKIEHEIIVD